MEVKSMYCEPFPENKKLQKIAPNPTDISSFYQLQKEFFWIANTLAIFLLDRPFKNSVRSEKFNNESNSTIDGMLFCIME